MAKPIRALQVLGALKLGGAETFVMSLYRATDRTKVQFDFVKHRNEQGTFEEAIIKMGGKVYVCPRYTVKNHFAYCKWWNDFFAEHPEYHVVHGHVRSTAAIYLKIAKNHGLCTIAHSHSTSNGSGVSEVVKDIMQLPIRHTADYLFACSDRAGTWLYGQKAVSRENYRMIPNGIDLQRFAFNSDKRVQMRTALKIEATDYVIGHTGRFTEPKNHRFLIDVFAEIAKVMPSAKLLLVGDGEVRKPIEQQCKELNIADKVIFAGAKSNTEDYYQAMDVFVFPSLWEGLGIVAIEAQAAGLPVVAADTVPSDIAVTENVQFLSLSAGKEEWAEIVCNMPQTDRAIANDQVGQKGYDIADTAQKLQEFYLKIEPNGDR